MEIPCRNYKLLSQDRPAHTVGYLVPCTPPSKNIHLYMYCVHVKLHLQHTWTCILYIHCTAHLESFNIKLFFSMAKQAKIKNAKNQKHKLCHEYFSYSRKKKVFLVKIFLHVHKNFQSYGISQLYICMFLRFMAQKMDLGS